MANPAPQYELHNTGPAYGEDYGAWVEHQQVLLREHRFDELDIHNLVEEVGDLGTSAYKGWLSAIRLVMLHMLKWDYQPGYRTRSWVATIAIQQVNIEDGLIESPSYRSKITAAVARVYNIARLEASGETDLPLRTFPVTCPYDWEMITTRKIALPGEDA